MTRGDSRIPSEGGSVRGRSSSMARGVRRSPSPSITNSNNPATTSDNVMTGPGTGANAGARPGIGVLYNADRGFMYTPFNVNRGQDPTPIEWCDRNNVLFCCPFKPGERAFRYNAATDRLYMIYDNEDEVLAANSARVTQFLRPASENFHAAMKQMKLFSGVMDQHHFDPVGQNFINRYNHLFGVDLDASWGEVSLATIEWIAAVGLYNRFHPKFVRRFPDAFQVMIAERILFCMETPNIILDQHIQFDQDIQGFPSTSNVARQNLAGYNSFPCNSLPDILRLNLPQMEVGDIWEMFLLGGGEYTFNKAMGILTAAREWELKAQRASSSLGSTANYTQLASELPQTLPVFYFEQVNEPTFFDSARYGQWPGPCVILKMAMPSSNRSMGSAAFHRCVTLIICQNPISPQPFCLQGHLVRHFGLHCTCESGMRTNSVCEHIQAVNILLLNPRAFATAKRKETRISDVRRPDDHRSIYGTPAGQRNRQVQFQPAPRPQPRTRDRRLAKRQRNFQNFPGHTGIQVQPPVITPSTGSTPGTSTSNTGNGNHGVGPSTGTTPITPTSNTGNGNRGVRPVVPHISGLGGLLNLANTCYGLSVVQMLSCIFLHNNINMPALPGPQQRLAQQVVNVCGQRANAAIPPFTIIPLVNDLNACLPQVMQFVLGQQECAAEFLHYLMENLDVAPMFLAVNYENGNCHICGSNSIQVCQSIDAHALGVVPPLQVAAVPLSPLIIAKYAAPVAIGQLQCRAVGPCQGLPIQQVRMVEQQGLNKIIHISRNVNAQQKVLTPITEPIANDPAWPGMFCKCVLAHCGRNPGGGHWIAFIKVNAQWFRCDDNRAIILENPFIGQINPAANPSVRDYTVNLLLFST